MRLSCLTDPKVTVVCDASTIINLNATGCAVAILGALPNPFVISEVALGELQEDIRNGRNDAKLVGDLQSIELVKVVALNDESTPHFETLVAGRTINTLDDGEAATIACANAMGAMAIIDERKATRICRERYPNLLLGSTIDILAHESMAATLGAHRLSKAVTNALQHARMRVLPHHLPWVVDVIGPENVGRSPSLPAHVRRQNMATQER